MKIFLLKDVLRADLQTLENVSTVIRKVWKIESYLPIIRIAIRASIRRRARLTTSVVQTTTLSISGYSCVRRESQNEIRCMFSGHNNEGGGIRGRHAGEDTRVNDEHVVCAVDLGVEINH
jgi:hypothetical protein